MYGLYPPSTDGLRPTYRVSLTSSASTGICRSELSKSRLTWHESAPFLSFPPFQMRSVSLPARIAFELFGPRTNRMASAMLLFPEPFGPVIAVKPWRKGTVIFRPNDLKFSIWISFRNKGSPDRWKVSAGGRCTYPSHLYPSGVRRGSDANAQRGHGYKSVAGWRAAGLTNCIRRRQLSGPHRSPDPIANDSPEDPGQAGEPFDRTEERPIRPQWIVLADPVDPMGHEQDDEEQGGGPHERRPEDRCDEDQAQEGVRERQLEGGPHFSDPVFQDHLILPRPIPGFLARELRQGRRMVVKRSGPGDELPVSAEPFQSFVEVPIDAGGLPRIVPTGGLEDRATVGDVPGGNGIPKVGILREPPTVRLRPGDAPLGRVDPPRIVLHRHDDGDANALGTHTDETREQAFKSISPARDQMGGRPVAGAARVFYEEIWRRKVREGPRPEEATAIRETIVAPYIPSWARVLDVGCGTGKLFDLLPSLDWKMGDDLTWSALTVVHL